MEGSPRRYNRLIALGSPGPPSGGHMLPASTAKRHSRLIAPLAIALMPLLGSVAMADTDARLADAAMKRDTAAVRALVEQKVDVNAPGRDGTPALHWLVRVADLELAEPVI